MPRQIETFAKPIHAVHSNYGYDMAQARSRVGGNPQGGATGTTPRQNNRHTPSPLMGEESKVRVKTRQPHQRVIPSKARNLNSPTRRTGFKAVSTARVDNNTNQPQSLS